MRLWMHLVVWVWMATELAAVQNSQTQQFAQVREKFVIFPVGQSDNALYQNGVIVERAGKKTFLDLIRVDGTPAWLLVERTEESVLEGKILFDKANDLRLGPAGYGVFEVRNVANGRRQIFRTYQGQLESLMGEYKSVRNPVASATHLIFAHIRDSWRSRGGRTYEFQLHLMRHSDPEFVRLELFPQDTTPLLQMEWLDESRLRLRYANRKTETFDLKRYAPQLFR